ncbi:MAG: 7,8-didemethyl-8-hydroxy-5-deazariboflavin synthase subunit CofG [Halobacteria archaeon]|nr:7,8-didemethyl-8-hydroxy-5-deazariboflavin synthase subunit CofG [Halobacteria archaeon]
MEVDVETLLSVHPEDVDTPDEVTFARNVFLPLTTACKNSCDYCAFYDRADNAKIMSREEVRRTLRTGKEAGCTEALFSFGTRPEVFPTIEKRLEKMGFDSILDYLYVACEEALDMGVLPHSNPGLLTYEEMERLKEVNASMGLMLETTAEVPAHEGFETKKPEKRLEAIENAGKLSIPFTTGFLVGIGETWEDRARSILAVRELEERYGHIQEVIVQNVVPNERSDYERPPLEDMKRMVAMARVGLPESVEVQVPPNLSRGLPELVRSGAGDLGGVSPVTDDYINPDYKWPAVRELEETAEEVGVPLKERLPVYPQYFETKDTEWISEKVLPKVKELNNTIPA